MKKNLLLIILFMMFMPIFVNAETCDTDKISISSITMENKSDSVEELDAASASGKNINLDLSMSEVGDNIKYKIVVKNDSDEDYELVKDSLNVKSNYLNYTFESADNSNIIKAHSSKNIYLRVIYANKVPDDAFETGIYNDTKSLTINLSTGNTKSVTDILKNPKTGVNLYIFILLIILLAFTTYLVLRKKKYTSFMILIIGTFIVIPISVYALCKCNLVINSDVKIVAKEKVAKVYYSYCYAEPLEEYNLPYKEGMTGLTFLDSDYMEYVPQKFITSLFNNAALLYEFRSTDNIKSCINSKQLIAHPNNEEERQLNYLYKENLGQCINEFGTLIEDPNDYIYPSNQKEYLIRDTTCPTT